MTATAVSAALLVGGRSTRMGEDKSLLICDPEQAPLYQVQLSKLRQVAQAPLLLSVHQGQSFSDLANDVETICDQADDLGPLSGLSTCLEHCPSPWLLVLAVDLPHISPVYLLSLIEQAQRTGLGVIPKMGDHWEPLAAIYPRSLLKKMQHHLSAGQLSLQKFIHQSVAEGLLLGRDISDSEKPLFSNLNTPQDLRALKNQAQTPFDIQQWITAADQAQPALISHHNKPDLLATEEPVELRVEGKSIAVLMRTPGHDRELAAGFLLSENVIQQSDDIFEISLCSNDEQQKQTDGQVIDVLLKKGLTPPLEELSRHVFTSSSCGICGKTSIDSVFQSFPPLTPDQMRVASDTLLSLPKQLQRQQANFQSTGGAHASALFTTDGRLQSIREDVGRHNALDKITGNALLNQSLPLSNTILLLSGRISFELMQKSLAAGIPFVAGISAPSSLAVKFARASGQTLVGFLRDQSFNVYSNPQRIVE
ncbi:MAG: formate dehydrogenase accessory sulfurtransferase FdhD [Verrucomicrobiales bacterium]|nr:formate dehydrogenase accessory sulfurtransferase FdhD [Verrucomicrobiales bacterium]